MMNGIQLATELRNLQRNKNFNQELVIVLVAAEEYDNKEGLFNELFYKPLPNMQIFQVYNK